MTRYNIPSWLLSFALVACATPEKGIDDTTLSGTVEIPPAAEVLVDSVPDEGGVGGNTARDTYDTAMGVGTLSYRWQKVTSNMRAFGEFGDEDWFSFSPTVTGAFTVRVEFGTAATFGAPGGPGGGPGGPGGTDTDTDTTTTTSTDTGTSTTDGGTTGTDDTGTTSTDDTGTTSSDDTGTTSTDDTGTTGTDDTGTTGTSTDDTATDTATDTGTSAADGITLGVYLYDAADLITYTASDGSTDTFFPEGAELVYGETAGDGGVLDLVIAAERYNDAGDAYTGLQAGSIYYVRVVGISDTTEAGSDYSIWFSGSDPNDGALLIGAYPPFGGDQAERGNPVAGSTLRNWELDAETLTWIGEYSMLYVREVTPTPEEPGVLPDVNIGITEVELSASDAATVNQLYIGGTFYSAQTVAVTLVPDAANTVDEPLILNAFSEAAEGWTVAEVEPNDVDSTDGGYTLDLATIENAQQLDAPSGIGFIDTVTGSSSFSVADPGWTEGYDVYAITMEETMGVYAQVGWSAGALDLDWHMHDSAGEFIAYSWYDNPEYINTGEWGITMEAGETYYFQVLPWSGEAGDYDYTITFEWLGL